ncbi:MAG: carboxypeptidase regulatory-like domain-containing protein [Ilumatobacteraceae bacterium]
MRISLDRTEVDIRPGRAARVTVELHNTGDSADMVSLSIDVPGSAWVMTSQPVTRVSRAETVFVIAEVQVGHDVAAGVHDAVLWARSASDPGRSVATRLRLTVDPVPGVRLVLSPSVLDTRSESSTTGTVTNTGNTPLSVSLGTRDPAGQVRCEISPSTLTLPVGGSAEVALAVSVPRRTIGSTTRRLIGVDVSATSPSGEITTEEYVTVRHRPVLARRAARWLFSALGLGAALIAAFALWSSGGAEPSKTPAPGFIVGGVESAPTGSVNGVVVATSDRAGVPRVTIEALRDAGDGTLTSYGRVASDAEGAFTFDDLPGGTYRLAFSAIGFDDIVGDPFVVVPGTDLELDDAFVEGQPGSVTMALTVEDPAVLGPGGLVTVDAVSVTDRDDVTSLSVEPDSEGRVTVRLDDLTSPSVQRITVSAAGHTARVVDVVVGAGADVTAPDLIVTAEAGAITGRVIDTAAVPLGGVTVRATSGPVVFTTTTDAVTGTYEMAGLRAARTYVVQFSAEGYALQTLAVDVGAGETVNEVNGTLIGSSGSLAGTVTTSDGTPIGSARVTVRGVDTVTTTATLTSVAASGGPGSYRVSGLPVPGSYTVTVTADGFRPRTEAVTFVVASADTVLDVELVPSTASLTGTVSLDGAAVGGAVVRLDDGSETRSVVSASSPAGAYTFTGLVPGSYTLSASVEGGGEFIRLVRVSAGDALDVDLSLETGAPG